MDRQPPQSNAPGLQWGKPHAIGFSKVPATYRWSFDGDESAFELAGEDVLQARNTTMSDRLVPLD